MAGSAPDGGRARGWAVALITQIGVAGTTAHAITPPVTTYGRARPAPTEQPVATLPAIPGTARGVARAPVRGVAAVPGGSRHPGDQRRLGGSRHPAGHRPTGSGGRRGGWRGGRQGSTGPGRSGDRGIRGRGGQLRWNRAALVLIVLGVFATGLGFERITGTSLAQWLPGNYRPPPRDFPVMAASDPVSIAIPALSLQAAVHDVGLAADGTIEVPELNRHNEAGWYVASPTPGEKGPAVIVGHVDTRTGPSVFHQAGTLHPGAQIQIRRADGSVAVFEVNSVEQFDKSALPADRVYGDFSRPGLRLITCGGQWVGGGTGYADNVVVFASLVDARNG
ncbi:class F sortase [Solwaraspora sp. WMMB335]|uniref:class F sortase n=1 Tax=Solwaraspora sp. WMMB335 TaxID=3404118 RepID=UPI003B955F04